MGCLLVGTKWLPIWPGIHPNRLGFVCAFAPDHFSKELRTIMREGNADEPVAVSICAPRAVHPEVVGEVGQSKKLKS
jgi:hypothetical protein